jgi:hypothetical protein
MVMTMEPVIRLGFSVLNSWFPSQKQDLDQMQMHHHRLVQAMTISVFVTFFDSRIYVEDSSGHHVQFFLLGQASWSDSAENLKMAAPT